jgi:predicted ATPase
VIQRYFQFFSSPQRQLSFLKIIHDLETPGHAQFLISTHSPIILSHVASPFFRYENRHTYSGVNGDFAVA